MDGVLQTPWRHRLVNIFLADIDHIDGLFGCGGSLHRLYLFSA